MTYLQIAAVESSPVKPQLHGRHWKGYEKALVRGGLGDPIITRSDDSRQRIGKQHGGNALGWFARDIRFAGVSGWREWEEFPKLFFTEATSVLRMKLSTGDTIKIRSMFGGLNYLFVFFFP